MAGHFCEATICFLPMGGQVAGVPSGNGDPWKLGRSRCTMCQTVSLMVTITIPCPFTGNWREICFRPLSIPIEKWMLNRVALESWAWDGILGVLLIYCVVWGMLLDLIRGYKCTSVLCLLGRQLKESVYGIRSR